MGINLHQILPFVDEWEWRNQLCNDTNVTACQHCKHRWKQYTHWTLYMPSLVSLPGDRKKLSCSNCSLVCDNFVQRSHLGVWYFWYLALPTVLAWLSMARTKIHCHLHRVCEPNEVHWLRLQPACTPSLGAVRKHALLVILMSYVLLLQWDRVALVQTAAHLVGFPNLTRWRLIAVLVMNNQASTVGGLGIKGAGLLNATPVRSFSASKWAVWAK